MNIVGLDHVTVNVKDLEKSREFYSDVLKLKEAGFIHMGDHTLTYYDLPQGVRLELIDYKEKAVPDKIKETDAGIYRHFCLVSDQLDDVYETCCRNDIYVRKAPSYVEKLGCYAMLITDPNGVEIELIQR